MDGWRSVVNATMTAAQMKDAIADAFNLDASMLRLAYKWTTQQRNGGTKMETRTLDDSKRPDEQRTSESGRVLSIADLSLKMWRNRDEQHIHEHALHDQHAG